MSPAIHAALANVADHVIQFRMQKRFAATDGDDGRAEARQIVQAALHFHRAARVLRNRRTRLQYVHARLQRRMGIMCARIGERVEIPRQASLRISRARVRQ